MKPSTTVNKLALILSWLAGLIIVILPFHAFLTVWLSSGIGHYTLLRLWKELLLVIISAGAIYLLVKDVSLRRQFFKSRLAQLIGAYLLLSLSWGVASYALDKVTLKSLGFGMAVNLRFFIFFLAIWIIASKSQWLQKAWPKLLLIPASLAIMVGLLQRFILPYDVLKHFGYSENTIFPYQTINRDINYPRIMSTLRGANPLGAYLVFILGILAIFFLKFKNKRWIWGLFGIAGTLVLFFSHSRGAWIGAAASAIFLTWLSLQRQSKKLAIASFAGLAAVGLVSAALFWNNPTFQNYFFHTSDQSTIEESSNEEHLSAKREGFNQIVNEPLGRGIGTAGPASVYNENRGRIADNYFIQIGQETGWLGLAVFIMINLLVARKLWARRTEALARILLVSLAGLTAINLVSHAWTDDTLAYLWWGLAGIALAPAILTSRKRKQHEKNKQAAA